MVADFFFFPEQITLTIRVKTPNTRSHQQKIMLVEYNITGNEPKAQSNRRVSGEPNALKAITDRRRIRLDCCSKQDGFVLFNKFGRIDISWS